MDIDFTVAQGINFDVDIFDPMFWQKDMHTHIWFISSYATQTNSEEVFQHSNGSEKSFSHIISFS